MKYKITNLTGMRVGYKKIPFEPNETKILELESTYEHEYFLVEKIEKTPNQKSPKSMKRIKLKEVKQDGRT